MFSKDEIENIELDLLIHAIDKVYNYDFSNYSRAHIKRRIKHFQKTHNLESISMVQHFILDDEINFSELLDDLSIQVTEMFRNPGFYLSLRENVIPVLNTYPFPKIWIAGSATGEEVYSMAILLKEEGLYDRTHIYATDFNTQALLNARQGIYPIDRIKKYTANYQNAGGINSFSDYYNAFGNYVEIDSSLKKNISFSHHNLDKDGIFINPHLIICRNVLIYFNKELQNKVINLFTESLIPGGFLALGMKESLMFSNRKNEYKPVDENHKIFKKIMKIYD